jgi:hypothetical protein
MRHPGNDTDPKPMTARTFSARLGALLVALTALGLLTAGPASAASYETVGHFGGVLKAPEVAGQFPEEVQEGGVTAIAVNEDGNGGVAAGTFYTASGSTAEPLSIARFSPTGAFEEAWNPSMRCGPASEEPAHPTCEPFPAGGGGNIDVEINQSTGNVYVLLAHQVGSEPAYPHVLVYTPDGKLISQFGEGDPKGTIAESPAKTHERSSERGIAVNDSGEVYLFDADKTFHRRLMLFRPETPGDYEHYVYAGQSNDIASAPGGTPFAPGSPVLDDEGNIYVAGENYIAEYDPAQPSEPICTFKLAAGGIVGHTVNPATGEVFYYSIKNRQIHELSCNSEGKFVEKAAFDVTPQRGDVHALGVDPLRPFEPSRPPGVLYAATGESTPSTGSGGDFAAGPLGYILAPPKEIPPAVEAESISNVTSSTATLGAEINPKGAATSYSFQYLDEAAYQANEPDERQSLTVSATDGVLGLEFEDRRFGGPASASLSAGSKAVAVAAATATAKLSAASGTADVKGAEGKGTVIAGSNLITAVKAGKGKFEVGQGIAGAGIPTTDGKGNATTITAVKEEEGLPTFEIKISQPATGSAAGTTITSGTHSLSEVSTSEGKFEAGQRIEGAGIPQGTRIAAVNGSELELSQPASKPAEGEEVKAGSPILTSVSTSFGSFEAGQRIEGEGIPAGTTILAVGSGQLTLSSPVSRAGVAVAISSPGPVFWKVGEQVEGPGIPAGTTIVSLQEGEATLSNAATASGTGVVLRAGLPADAPAARVQAALEGVATIGAGNVTVSGGPGDEAGSNPYEITFTGGLENVDVPELSADSSGLSGGAATATVQTEHDGGNGFAGAIEVPAGGASLGEGQSAISAVAPLSGLAPDSGYRFRAVATSHCSAVDEAKVCEGTGTPLAFHTAPIEAPGLPDQRAYELVSPAQKNGGQVFPAEPNVASICQACKPGIVAEHFPMQSSPNGEALVYEGFPFSFSEGAVKFNEYLSRRNKDTGWQTTTLSPKAQLSGEHQGYKAFNPELTRGLLLQNAPPLTPDAPGEFADLYGQETADPLALSSLLSAEPPNRPAKGEGSFKLTYAGASADLSRVFFEANDALSEETPFAPEAIDGGAKKSNLYEWSKEGGLRLVNVQPGNAETTPGAAFGSGVQLASISNLVTDFSHAISTDGSRVFWSSESGQVYVREGGETTREIPDHSGRFLTASADGSKLLLSDGHLFDLGDEESMTDLSKGEGGFEGIAGQSEDLSHVYFVDTAVLDEAPNQQGNIARPGRDNLYSWQEGTTTFVATLAGEAGVKNDNADQQGDWAASPSQRTAESSPDGHWLAFLSRESLTGYDNVGACKFDFVQQRYVPSAPCEEAFLYDAETGDLRCVSCNPGNERPQGRTTLRKIFLAEGSLPQPRYLSDSGRLYFDSANALSPFDTNGNVEDVYQYEPEGVGNCTREGGCVSLISAGHEPVDSNFLTMDPSGKNVFFTTRDQLVLKDKDDLIDVYDAREGGGIPSETETGRGECQGEACQPLYSPPNDPTPGSSSFQGAGDVTETKAARKHAKKHKKKGHAKKKKHAPKRAAKHNRGGAK